MCTRAGERVFFTARSGAQYDQSRASRCTGIQDLKLPEGIKVPPAMQKDFMKEKKLRDAITSEKNVEWQIPGRLFWFNRKSAVSMGKQYLEFQGPSWLKTYDGDTEFVDVLGKCVAVCGNNEFRNGDGNCVDASSQRCYQRNFDRPSLYTTTKGRGPFLHKPVESPYTRTLVDDVPLNTNPKASRYHQCKTPQWETRPEEVSRVYARGRLVNGPEQKMKGWQWDKVRHPSYETQGMLRPDMRGNKAAWSTSNPFQSEMVSYFDVFKKVRCPVLDALCKRSGAQFGKPYCRCDVQTSSSPVGMGAPNLSPEDDAWWRSILN
jgi:hypothetical protein